MNDNNESNSHLNSAQVTSLSCPSEQKLRVPYYCEENVWRLAYRRLHDDCRYYERCSNDDHIDVDGATNTKEIQERKNTPLNSSNNKTDHQNHLVDTNQSIDSNTECMITSSTISEYYVVFISNPRKSCPMFHQLASKEPLKACFWDYHVILIQHFPRYTSSAVSVAEEAASPHSDIDEQNKTTLETNNQLIFPTAEETKRTLVFDLDSHLPYPCSLDYYLKHTFPYMNMTNKDDCVGRGLEQYAPMFRVVNANSYIKTFYSDRMHMYDKTTKKWSAQPPTYDIIMIEDEKGLGGENNIRTDRNISNLNEYIDMSRKRRFSKHDDDDDDIKHSLNLGDVYSYYDFCSKFGT